ncbi:hypothetical protein HOE425_332510 [Hoeflea sp. EC-HK425]|nr:hypothetical protein HOE425_332510 [Hoeflea sp. EC-HK425]
MMPMGTIATAVFANETTRMVLL